MDGPCQAITAALTDLRMRHQQAQALLSWAMKRDPPNFNILAALDAILDARPIRQYVPPGTDLPEWSHDKRAAPGEPRQITFPHGGGERSPTPLQRDILRHLGEGGTDATIGAAMGLTKDVVKHHIDRLQPLMGATNRVALAVEAHRRGYFE